jgi:hypothetical protein
VTPGASGVDARRTRLQDDREAATPFGTSVAPAVPGDVEDARMRAPAVRSTLRHSPVGVSTASAALPKKHQRDQPLHRSLHLVTSALD